MQRQIETGDHQIKLHVRVEHLLTPRATRQREGRLREPDDAGRPLDGLQPALRARARGDGARHQKFKFRSRGSAPGPLRKKRSRWAGRDSSSSGHGWVAGRVRDGVAGLGETFLLVLILKSNFSFFHERET